MHPHGVAGTPGNPGPSKGGLRRLNETTPPVNLEKASEQFHASPPEKAGDFSERPDKGRQQRQ